MDNEEKKSAIKNSMINEVKKKTGSNKIKEHEENFLNYLLLAFYPNY